MKNIQTIKINEGTNEKEAMRSLGRDRMFWAESIACSLAQAKHNDVYSFRYDFEPLLMKLAGLKATHGVDICSGLDTWSGGMYLFHVLTPKNRQQKIHNDMHGSFVNFCKTGEPGIVDGVKWQKYSNENRFTLLFNDKCGSVVNPYEKNYEIWKDLALYMRD